MNNQFRPLKGFSDQFNWELIQHRFVIEQCNRLAMLAQFHFCELPIVETLSTFKKPLAIIDSHTQSEFFYVETPKPASTPHALILRPELTTGLLRAYLANPVFCQKPTTLFSSGPCFRYENPQKGRLRQFQQWNLEQLRCKWTDIKQSLAFLANLLRHFKLTANIVIEINYLTVAKLKQLNQHLRQLSPTAKTQLCSKCQNRLEQKGNLYRIFDCNKCQKQFHNIFSFDAFLTPEEKTIFEQLRIWFEQLLPKVKIRINPVLVRGLAYYRGLVFEVKFQQSELDWAQNTLLAGGSYALKTFFDTPLTQTGQGFGFAIGIERFVIALAKIGFFDQLETKFATNKTVLIGYLTASTFLPAYQFQTELNQHNYIAQVAENIRHFPDLLQKTLAVNAHYLIVFDAEYERTKKLICKIIVSKNQPQQQFKLTWKEALKLIYENNN